MTYYIHNSGMSSPSFSDVHTTFGRNSRKKSALSIRINVLELETASPAAYTVGQVKQLPRPTNGRFSFRDLVSILNDSGRAAFDHQGTLRDAELRQQHERGAVTSLYFYRCMARFTQEQLADLARSRQSFISQVERRKRSLTWKQATKFASALGVTPVQLMEHA